jgi:hypothetical protein
LLLIEVPEFVKKLQEKYKGSAPTVATEWTGSIDFEESTLSVDGVDYRFPSVGEVAQSLIMCDGLENQVRDFLGKKQ